VTVLRIYPRSGIPRGKSVIFRTPDPLIDEFFRSLSDIRIYWPSHDTVTSQDHSWFLEVSTGGDPIQISFYIPSGKGARVAGEFGNWNLRSSVHYGDFQSQQLYDWYQKYSHRWLSPPAEQEEEGEKVRK
jgi:hypothetical protein